MKVIALKFLMISLFLLNACTDKEYVNQDLNREIDIQHQKLKQNREILFLEGSEMYNIQQSWNGTVEWSGNTNDPLFQEHIKSIEDHGLQLEKHIKKLKEFEQALQKQADVILKHRKGKINDEALVETQRILGQRQLKLNQDHESLREIHQILIEARELISKSVNKI